jgi:hypothetical protein
MNKTSLSCLTRISERLDQFVIQMSLCVVHGAKADDNSSMPKGAHMADMGFPVKYFKECLERTKEGQRISAHLPWPKKIEDGLDFQIGEGTGMLDPRGYRDPKGHVRMYLHQGKTITALKHPMVLEHGAESPFFLGGEQGWTRYFHDRGASLGFGGFWFQHAKQGTRGSLFCDFTNERSNVALRPMPEAPAEVQQLMIEANAFCIPPEPLVLSETTTKRKANHFLDQWKADVQALGRPEPAKTCPVFLYACPHQVTAEVGKGLYEDVRDTLQRVWKVDYKREDVTDQYHGYRLTFHVQVD